jgi:hypothetical protein
MLLSYFWLAVFCSCSLRTLTGIRTFSFPFEPNVAFLFTSADMRVITSNEIVQQKTVIAMISRDLSTDSYFALYCGNILELFRDLTPDLLYLIYQPEPHLDLLESSIEFISKLPPKSIFINFEHGMSAFGIKNVELLIEYGIPTPPIIYHMNHEQPWNINPAVLDFTYSTIDELRQSYAKNALVLRNYYYEPLVSVSQYVPVGCPYSSFSFNNHTSPWRHVKSTIPLSERQYFCHFRGRFLYNDTSGEQEYDRLLLHPDRAWLLKLQSQHNKLQKCTLVNYDLYNLDPQGHFDVIEVYEDYLKLLSNTIFTLCPAGNNPETFRLYEVSLCNYLSNRTLLLVLLLLLLLMMDLGFGNWFDSSDNSIKRARKRFSSK